MRRKALTAVMLLFGVMLIAGGVISIIPTALFPVDQYLGSHASVAAVAMGVGMAVGSALGVGVGCPAGVIGAGVPCGRCKKTGPLFGGAVGVGVGSGGGVGWAPPGTGDAYNCTGPLGMDGKVGETCGVGEAAGGAGVAGAGVGSVWAICCGTCAMQALEFSNCTARPDSSAAAVALSGNDSNSRAMAQTATATREGFSVRPTTAAPARPNRRLRSGSTTRHRGWLLHFGRRRLLRRS